MLHGFNRSGLSFDQNAAIANYALPAGEVRSFLEARINGSPLSAYVSMPQNLLDSFGAHVDRWDVLAVAVPLMLLAAVATHFSARHSLAQQAPGQLPGVASVLRWMPWILPLGVLAGGALFPFPVAILVYWLTNNAWTLVQQHLVYPRSDVAPVLTPAAGLPAAGAGSAAGLPAAGAVSAAGMPAADMPPMRRRRRRHASGHRPSRRRR